MVENLQKLNARNCVWVSAYSYSFQIEVETSYLLCAWPTISPFTHRLINRFKCGRKVFFLDPLSCKIVYFHGSNCVQFIYQSNKRLKLSSIWSQISIWNGIVISSSLKFETFGRKSFEYYSFCVFVDHYYHNNVMCFWLLFESSID